MLDKIQTKIDGLEQGKKLILGMGIQAEEMQKVLSLCESLASDGQIRIVNVQKDPVHPQVGAKSIMIEKQ